MIKKINLKQLNKLETIKKRQEKAVFRICGTFKFIAFLLIFFGIIGGVGLMVSGEDDLVLFCLIGGFISGMVFIGFAKIIELLDSINNKL